MFRRRSAAPAAPESVEAAPVALKGHTAGKGRPTPKRSEAEKNRRQPVLAPRDRKEALRMDRAAARRERARKAEAIRNGDERELPPRDRGPAKALVRDYVDGRRTFGEYYMYLAFGLLGMMFIGTTARKPALLLLGYPIMLIVIAVIAVEAFMTSYRTKKLVAQRLPNEPVRGVGWYAVMRSLQLRRLRVPKPRVKAGQKT